MLGRFFAFKSLKIATFIVTFSCFTINSPVAAITPNVPQELSTIAALTTPQEQMLHYQTLLDAITQSNESPAVKQQLFSQAAEPYKHLIILERVRLNQLQENALLQGDAATAQIYERNTQELDAQLAAVEQQEQLWADESSVAAAPEQSTLKKLWSKYGTKALIVIGAIAGAAGLGYLGKRYLTNRAQPGRTPLQDYQEQFKTLIRKGKTEKKDMSKDIETILMQAHKQGEYDIAIRAAVNAKVRGLEKYMATVDLKIKSEAEKNPINVIKKLFAQKDWRQKPLYSMQTKIVNLIKDIYEKHFKKQVPKDDVWTKEDLDRVINFTLNNLRIAHPKKADWKMILGIPLKDFLTNAHIMLTFITDKGKAPFWSSGTDDGSCAQRNRTNMISNMILSDPSLSTTINAAFEERYYKEHLVTGLAKIVIAILNKDKFKSLPKERVSNATVEETINVLREDKDIDFTLIDQIFDLVIEVMNEKIKFAAIDPKIQKLTQKAKKQIKEIASYPAYKKELEEHKAYKENAVTTAAKKLTNNEDFSDKFANLLSSIVNRTHTNNTDVKKALLNMDLTPEVLDEVIGSRDLGVNNNFKDTVEEIYKALPHTKADLKIIFLFERTNEILENFRVALDTHLKVKKVLEDAASEEIKKVFLTSIIRNLVGNVFSTTLKDELKKALESIYQNNLMAQDPQNPTQEELQNAYDTTLNDLNALSISDDDWKLSLPGEMSLKEYMEAFKSGKK